MARHHKEELLASGPREGPLGSSLPAQKISKRIAKAFIYPQVAWAVAPNVMSVRRDSPLHMTMFPIVGMRTCFLVVGRLLEQDSRPVRRP